MKRRLKRMLRRDSPRETESENGSETHQVTENSGLTEKDFDDITNRIEKIKRFRVRTAGNH